MKKRITLSNIKNAVELYFGVEIRENKSRKKEIVQARHMFCYIAFSYDYNKSEIARYLDLNHASVIHAIKNIAFQIQTYDDTRINYRKVLNGIKADAVYNYWTFPVIQGELRFNFE